jgi:hypothetical protein
LPSFFRKSVLTAFLGKVSSELSAVTLGSANAWSAAARVSGPLFQGGRLTGQYRQRKAAREEARLRYQYTVLTAFQDVANALISREKRAEIREQQAREVKALAAAVHGLHQALPCRQSQLLRSPRSPAAALSSRIESRARRTGSALGDRPTLQGFGRWLGHGSIIPCDGRDLSAGHETINP